MNHNETTKRKRVANRREGLLFGGVPRLHKGARVKDADERINLCPGHLMQLFMQSFTAPVAMGNVNTRHDNCSTQPPSHTASSGGNVPIHASCKIRCP